MEVNTRVITTVGIQRREINDASKWASVRLKSRLRLCARLMTTVRVKSKNKRKRERSINGDGKDKRGKSERMKG